MKRQLLLLFCFFVATTPYTMGNEATPLSLISNVNLSDKEKISWLEENFLTKNILTNPDVAEIQKRLPKVSLCLAVALYKFLYYQGYSSRDSSDLVLQKVIASLKDENISVSQEMPAIIEFLSFISKTDKVKYPKYLKSISIDFFKRINDDKRILEIILDKDNEYYEYIRSELPEGSPLNPSVEIEYTDRVEFSAAYQFLYQILSSQEKLQVKTTKDVFYKTLLDISDKENYYQQYGLLKLYATHLLQDIYPNDLKLIEKYKKSTSKQIVALVESIVEDIDNRSLEKSIQIYDKPNDKNASRKIFQGNFDKEKYLACFTALLEAEKHEEIADLLRKNEIPSPIRLESLKIYYCDNYSKDKVDAFMWWIFQAFFDDSTTREDFLVFLSTPLSGTQHRIQISETLQDKMLSLLSLHDDKDANKKILLKTVSAFAQVSLPFPKRVAEAILSAFEVHDNDPILRKACIFALTRITKVNSKSIDLNFWRKAVSSMPDDPPEEKEGK